MMAQERWHLSDDTAFFRINLPYQRLSECLRFFFLDFTHQTVDCRCIISDCQCKIAFFITDHCLGFVTFRCLDGNGKLLSLRRLRPLPRFRNVSLSGWKRQIVVPASPEKVPATFLPMRWQTLPMACNPKSDREPDR